jgi:hypothetical protein
VSCGLQDVLELEALGTPAVLVASAAFTDAAERQAMVLGQPALARVFVPHPIQDRTDAEMRALARDAVGALLVALDSGAGEDDGGAATA